MKYIWFLAFPYVVVVSSISRWSDHKGLENVPIYSVERYNCMYEKEFCQDLAAALNEGHERRVGTENLNNVLYWKK